MEYYPRSSSGSVIAEVLVKSPLGNPKSRSCRADRTHISLSFPRILDCYQDFGPPNGRSVALLEGEVTAEVEI